MRYHALAIAIATSLLLAAASPIRAETPATETVPDPAADRAVAKLVEQVTSDDKDVRYAARSAARTLGARAINPLGRLLEHESREVRITALRALEQIVHHAGRPGAAREALAASRSLARVVRSDSPQWVKLELLSLVAHIGGDAIVPRVSGFLHDPDPHVRETARLALERIPTRAASGALIRAVRESTGADRVAFLFSLGKKRDPALTSFLLSQAYDRDEEVRLAALRALAHAGAPEAQPAFRDEIQRSESHERAQLFGELLRLADELADAGRSGVARHLFGEALKAAPEDYQRERALVRLADMKKDAPLETLLSGLADPAARVRSTALDAISALPGDDVNAALAESFSSSEGEARILVLRALAERDPEAAAPLVTLAAESSDVELRVTALDLRESLAQPEMVATYLDLATKGSASIRPVAVRGYLLVADRKHAAGEAARKEAAGRFAGAIDIPDAELGEFIDRARADLLAARKRVRDAGAMYVRAIDLAASDDQRVAAIEGIERVGDPSAVNSLRPFLDHPVVGGAASRVFAALATRLAESAVRDPIQIDAAEKALLAVLEGRFPRTLRVEAMERLAALGRDPQKPLRTKGFVLDWWLIGPIADETGNGLAEEFFPEKAREFEGEHRIGPRRYRWQRPRLLTRTGAIDFLPRFRRSSKRIAYAYTELVSSSEQDVIFRIGSNDGVACWLNDERIHFKPGTRSLKIDEDRVEAHLKRGKNSILLKVNNVDGDWGMSFRVTTTGDRPLPLEVDL